MKRPLFVTAALLFTTLLAHEAYAGGTRAAQKKRAVEADAKRIEKLLTAPCCYKGTLADHASGLANRMRGEIRTMLAQGKSQDQILAHYKKKYGQAVLVEPPGGGFSSFLLYGVPFGLAFIGLLVMTVLLARKRGPDAAPGERLPTDFEIPPEMNARIDRLIKGATPAPGPGEAARG